MNIFHPDIVWPMPKIPQSHNQVDWIFDLSRFNYERWKQGWLELFTSHRVYFIITEKL